MHVLRAAAPPPKSRQGVRWRSCVRACDYVRATARVRLRGCDCEGAIARMRLRGCDCAIARLLVCSCVHVCGRLRALPICAHVRSVWASSACVTVRKTVSTVWRHLYTSDLHSQQLQQACPTEKSTQVCAWMRVRARVCACVCVRMCVRAPDSEYALHRALRASGLGHMRA